MDEARAAQVAALRARIARMGGLPGGRIRTATPGSPAPAEGRTALGAPGGLDPSLQALGFAPELTASGLAWVRRTSVDLGPFLEAAAAPGPVAPAQLLGLAAGGAGLPALGWGEDELAVLDIESLGLRGSGVVAFLVGIGVPRGARLEIDQLLLVDLGAETAQLTALLEPLARCRMIITYNGRSFDMPVLRARAVVNRLHGWCEPPLHCDLLAPVRRLFRDRLGACTLRQAEQALLALHRADDVPGCEAPARYRIWLHSGRTAVIEGVVQHNQLDLCATMVLAARLAAHVEGRLVQPPHPADRYRLGVHLERRGGVADEVDGHLRAAATAGRAPWGREAALRLSRRLRRLDAAGAQSEAVELLRGLVEADADDLRAARQLAIALERLGRLREALAVSEGAVTACGRLGEWRLRLLRSAPGGGWHADWERRRRRLRGRVERAGRISPPREPERQSPPPPGAAAGGGVPVTPPLFAYWAKGICQSASPSE